VKTWRLVDGAGGFASGRYVSGAIIDAGAKQMEPEGAVRFHVFQAALPPERLDYALEKAVEAGADLIVVFRPERSGLGKRIPERADRWRRIAREAAKQCGRAALSRRRSRGARSPRPSRPGRATCCGSPIPRAIGRIFPPVFRAPASSSAPRADSPTPRSPPRTPAGAVPVKLGPWILRSETVAPAGLALLQYGYGSTRR